MITDDPNEPQLREHDDRGMQKAYLVLSAGERAQGFVRPLRSRYRHVGAPAPVYPLRDLTPEEAERYATFGYVKFEEYLRFVPDGAPYPPYDPESSITGRFWTQEQLNKVGKGCGTVTTMAKEIAETYARNPSFYGGTYCAGCRDHFPVGPQGEFIWEIAGARLEDAPRVGV